MIDRLVGFPAPTTPQVRLSEKHSALVGNWLS